MSEAAWYYMKGQERVGPVSLEQIRSELHSGGVSRTDLVWADGMPQWAPASTVSALSPAVSAQQVTHVQVPRIAAPAEAISYYSTSMPPRAASHLSGHARPTGDVGDWPLDDQRISLFSETVRLRKHVTSAAHLYRALLFLSIVFAATFLLIFGIMMAISPRVLSVIDEMMAIPAVVMAAVSVLYYFCWRGTMRAQRWAPLTMFSLFTLGIVLQVGGCTIAASEEGAPAVIGGTIGLLFSIAFAYISWRSFANIPKYLAQPAWCQELIVKANL